MRIRKITVLIVAMVIATASLSGCGNPEIAEVPDPQYFFQNTHDEVNEHDDVKQVILRSESDLWTEAAAYVNLLKYSGKYQFDTYDETLYSNGDYRWDFEYTGPEEIEDAYFSQIEITYFKNTDGRGTYAVWITLHDLDNFKLVQNDVYDPNNIYGTEAYTQATQQSTSSWDSGSSWEDDDDDSDWDSDDDFWDDDNDDLYDAKVQCGVCNGDGDCTTCGGDGYLYSSASDKEDRNCYSCSGSGNCRSCGGDGEL